MKVLPPKLGFCDTAAISKGRNRADSVKAEFGSGLRPLYVSVEILKPKVKGLLNSKDIKPSISGLSSCCVSFTFVLCTHLVLLFAAGD